MKKCLLLVMTLIIMLPTAVYGELKESFFTDFEEGKGNLLTQNADVVKSASDGNSSLVLNPAENRAYIQKAFRNMTGGLIAGFKAQISGSAKGNFYFVSDNGEIIKVLTFENGKITGGTTELYEYKEDSEIKIAAFINTANQNIIFDINGKKSEKIKYNKISSGISGFAADGCGNGEIQLDNMYCYVGDKLLDEYDMMSASQQAMVRTKNSAIYSVYGGSILNGKIKKDAAGVIIYEGSVYLPLRNTLEAVGGIVNWTDGVTTVEINGEKIVLEGKIKEQARIIDSVTYLPKNVYSEQFGIKMYEDIGGVYMLSLSDGFVKSNKEKALYQELVKSLTGNELMFRTDGTYSITPSDFDNFYMQRLPVSSVWASSESQPELGYVKENVVDGDLVSRWSSDENGAELVLDLGEPQKIDAVALAFMNGTIRRAYFEIYTSNDNKNWNLQIPRTETSGKTDLREVYAVSATARYVKYKGYGTSTSVWNSVTEFNALKIKQEYVY